MMTKDEALKMAIEAMNSAYSSHGKILTSMPAQDAWLYHGCDAKLFKALQACKEALEQPAQEPMAWMSSDGIITKLKSEAQLWVIKGGSAIPLYTHPAPACQECENLKHDLDGYMEACNALVNFHYYSEEKNKKQRNKEFVGLSDDERFIIVQNADWDNPNDIAELIEQALKTKNGKV